MFAACKAALPHIRKTKGNIINLSSLVGSMAQDKAVTYVATKVRVHTAIANSLILTLFKGAIIAFTKALAIDEAANFVRVNCVSPGNVWTPMWKVSQQHTSAAI
jgi:NAD(P)-dependent dehydrogenase (short-subunit alcohol dehydrogenase family)